MLDIDKPETFKTIISIEPEKDEMKTINIDLSDYPGFDKYLAFRMPETNLNAHFKIDNIKLKEDTNIGKYVASIVVIDEQNNPVKNATITMGDSVHITDTTGTGYFIKLKSGNYNFIVSNEQYFSKNGNITIDNNNAKATVVLQLLGIKNNMLNSVFIYPNPVKNTVTVSSEKSIKEIKIYDIFGRLLLQKFNLKKEAELNLSGICQGVFFINIKFTDNTILNKRMMKE
jgi:hypothetical protein